MKGASNICSYSETLGTPETEGWTNLSHSSANHHQDSMMVIGWREQEASPTVCLSQAFMSMSTHPSTQNIVLMWWDHSASVTWGHINNCHWVFKTKNGLKEKKKKLKSDSSIMLNVFMINFIIVKQLTQKFVKSDFSVKGLWDKFMAYFYDLL